MNTHALVSFEIPLELNHNTADLVVRFAHVLAEKLLLAQRKHGYQDRWLDASNAGDHRRELMRHIYKGDPLDVAAYCAFLWHHGEHARPETLRWNIEGPHEDGSISICFGKHGNHEGCKLEKFVPADTAHRMAVEERAKLGAGPADTLQVLRELVELKALKAKIDTHPIDVDDLAEYQRRQPTAWAEARNIVARYAR